MAKDKRSGNGHDPADPDDELWRRITAGVKPLRSRTGTPPTSPQTDQPKKSEGHAPTRVSFNRPVVPPARIQVRDNPELAQGVAAGLDKRTLAKLRRGQIPIEAEIDLHGSTQDQAHRALQGFLERSQAAGRRCVLVITGKGFRADGASGVLRNAVPRWMNETPNSERILAFTHATPPDGGEGALYVLLRRARRSGQKLRE